ncbi:MAG TPA: universal stress protein [Candidatus Acidoferrales bacterium]|nr:universal stress protein [Candidatus Acidoferrales bacterium]
MFQRALVPVDGSPYMSGVVAHAIAIAKKTNCSLTFLYVANVDPTSSYVANVKPATSLEVEKQRGSNMRIPEVCRQKAAAEDISASSRVEVGSPAQTIVELSVRERFDLIIIGSRGYSRLKTLFLGSVADEVMEQASCPVLLVK